MKKLRLVILGLIVLLIIGAFMPQDYKVERSIEINSTLKRPFLLSNNLTYWPQWNPWALSDPAVKVTIDKSYQGAGASQHWTDTNGGGHLTITESIPNKRISYNIWFGSAKEPAISTLAFEEVDNNRIKVHWTIEGDVQIPVVGFMLAMVMDNLMGSAFDSGLKKLKYESEKVVG